MPIVINRGQYKQPLSFIDVSFISYELQPILDSADGLSPIDGSYFGKGKVKRKMTKKCLFCHFWFLGPNAGHWVIRTKLIVAGGSSHAASIGVEFQTLAVK